MTEGGMGSGPNQITAVGYGPFDGAGGCAVVVGDVPRMGMGDDLRHILLVDATRLG
jgi:hypothetical protein